MLRLRRHLAAALVAASVLACSGCVDLEQMQFVKDDRLEFQSPEDYALVELPLEVSWTMEDFEVLPEPRRSRRPGKRDEQGDNGRGRRDGAGAQTATRTPAPSEDAGYFAVFVDRAPIKPGRTLDDVWSRRISLL